RYLSLEASIAKRSSETEVGLPLCFFSDSAVKGQILDRVSFVLGQLRVAYMESCTSNLNPPSSENG
ncbi:hypothetical protein, partial [Neisseria sp. HMSC70E02]|uniref:hypothetical protein n=1 Tax=Neisseria sp. HMSC70E02 TaxID=1608896 RepID=UPI001AF020B0